LAEARRILVFMDGSCHERMARSDVHARYLNERYLVVPVYPGQGVFHAKVHLLVHKDMGTVFCGSNNLTQAGCTNNLELLNVLELPSEGNHEHRGLLRQAMEFFVACLPICRGAAKQVAETWLNELKAEQPWLMSDVPTSEDIRLVHTRSGSLWDQLVAAIGNEEPKRLSVISPFYDEDLALLEKIRDEWPKCSIEITAQEHTSNLPVKLLPKFGKAVKLYGVEVSNSRRLHAKLIVAHTTKRAICLAGSANFTSAAFEGRNVEACLLLCGTEDPAHALFDGQLKRSLVEAHLFEPGIEREPSKDVEAESSISLLAVALHGRGQMTVQYRVKQPGSLAGLSLALQKHGEEKPSKTMSLPVEPSHFKAIQIDDAVLKAMHGSVRCYLEAEKKDASIEKSNCVWLIQEAKLTYIPGGGAGGDSQERTVRETGRGTTEYLDVLAQREGYQAVVDFLYHLNIKYQSGMSVPHGGGGYGLQEHDPTLSDEAPEWTRSAGKKLEDAIFDFVDRHHDNVLRKHARRGDINGLTNFLDVFVECNKLLYLYYRRGRLTPFNVQDRLLRSIGIFTVGHSVLSDKEYVGYLKRILEEQEGNKRAVTSAIVENRVGEHLSIALYMAQVINCKATGKGQPADCLPSHRQKVLTIFKELSLRPNHESLRGSLAYYPFLSAEERQQWADDIGQQLP
jgi:hypothetical protein